MNPADVNMKRMLNRVLATVIVAGLSILTLKVAVPEKARAERPLPRPAEWTPPTWHPDGQWLWSLPMMQDEATQKLRLSSAAAFVFDVDRGEVLVAKGADERRPVASLTKVVSALSLASANPRLDREECVDARFYPTRSGARSRFSTGDCYTGWDYIGAALVSSDNRGAYGMQVFSGLSFDDFIARMDSVSDELGMSNSTWAEPSGLEDENLSTARDMTHAVVALAGIPQLATVASAPSWRIQDTRSGEVRELGSTDRLLEREGVDIIAAKTGYTDTAGYCFTAVAQVEGRTLAFTLLGAGSNNARWSDAEKVLALAR